MAEKSRDILLNVSSGFTPTIVEATPQTAVPWSSQTRLENVLASPENYLVVSRIILLKRRLDLRSLVWCAIFYKLVVTISLRSL